MKKYIEGALIGAFCSSIYPIIIAVFMGNKDVVITANGNKIGWVFLQLVLSMSIGVFAVLLSKLTFEIGNFSLLMGTIIHMLGISIYVVGVGFICKWFYNFESIVFVGVGFIIIYAIIYGVSYVNVMKEVKKTNEALANKNK